MKAGWNAAGAALGVTIFGVLACGNATPPSESPDVQVDAADPSAPAEPPPAASVAAPVECGTSAEAEAAYADGMRLLAEAKDGEHYVMGPYLEGMRQLKRAAAAGHLEAQAKYGMTNFSNMFQAQAPTPEERDDYVLALTYVLVASKRGHQAAHYFLPGLAEMKISNGRPTPPPEPPLDSIEEDWLVAALADAESWKCPDAD